MNYFPRIIFFTISIFFSPVMALDYLDLSPNTELKVTGESCTFKDDIVISKETNGIKYSISGSNKKITIDLDEDTGNSIVIADISGDGYCDLLGVMTGSSQVNEYFDFFEYKENDKTFNKIGVEASDPLIDNTTHKIISKYRSGPRWWRDAYCQKSSFKKCEEGFWFVDDVYVVKDLIEKKTYFVNNREMIIQSPQITVINATKGIEKGENGRILDARIEEVVRLKIQFSKKTLWVNEEDIKITSSSDREIRNKTYLYKFPSKKTKMYLIKGDKITLLDKKTDNTNQKWYFINYKGKKDLTMWIKAEAVDAEPDKETKEKAEQKIKPSTPKEPEPAPQTKIQITEPIEVVKQELNTTPPENAEVIKAEKAEPIEQSASGSTSLTFLASFLGLLAWRAS